MILKRIEAQYAAKRLAAATPPAPVYQMVSPPLEFFCPRCLKWHTGFSRGEVGWCDDCVDKEYPRASWFGKGIYHLANLPCIETGRIIGIPKQIEMDTMPTPGKQYKACPICFPPEEDSWNWKARKRR